MGNIEIDNFIKQIEEKMYNDDIYQEIISQVERVQKNGIIIKNGNAVYGKSNKKDGEDFKLRQKKKSFFCSYNNSIKNNNINVIMEQTKLDNGLVKLEKIKKIRSKEIDDTSKYQNIIMDYLYKDGKLVYDSTTYKQEDYRLKKNNILCNISDSSNIFSISKRWYIDKYVIKYTLDAGLFNDTKEIYSICVKNKYYEITKETFEQIMLGNITISEFINTNKQKILKKES
ncbi:MAG TPA: hypothetical protein PLV83_04150 [Bacilli bacterium]|nr:hypothetical protein [Bacilli bacterium]